MWLQCQFESLWRAVRLRPGDAVLALRSYSIAQGDDAAHVRGRRARAHGGHREHSSSSGLGKHRWLGCRRRADHLHLIRLRCPYAHCRYHCSHHMHMHAQHTRSLRMTTDSCDQASRAPMHHMQCAYVLWTLGAGLEAAHTAQHQPSNSQSSQTRPPDPPLVARVVRHRGYLPWCLRSPNMF